MREGLGSASVDEDAGQGALAMPVVPRPFYPVGELVHLVVDLTNVR